MTRRLLPGLLCLALAGSGLRADRLSVRWTPVAAPSIAGYRVEVRTLAGTLLSTTELSESESSFTTTDVPGGCEAVCVEVRSVSDDGETSPPATLCGLPDPEILDVREDGSELRIEGDNFAPDAIVVADGQELYSQRESCATLVVPAEDYAEIEVLNPADGIDATFDLTQGGSSVAILACRPNADGTLTVTSFSHTPGMGQHIEADEPGLGTDCAAALALLTSRTNSDPRTLPLGTDILYWFGR